MTWFKVDDTLPHHPKVMTAGNAAMGLWVRAGAWSMQQLTDGYVPRDVARNLGKPAEAKRLVESGLWLEKDDGYLFHQFTGTGRQPSRVEVESARAAGRERQRLARERSQSRRDDAVTATVTLPEVPALSHPPRPGQSRPGRF